MTEIATPFVIGLLIGGLIGWLWAKSQFSAKAQSAKDAAQQAYNQLQQEYIQYKATAQADNRALQEMLNTHKQGMEQLNQKFNTEFENIANKIIETKTEKFTQLNKTNLETLLGPLGKNIDEFKQQVNKVYQDESKERFSLGEKVKELALLNLQLSEDAKNLTRALKGEAKTQGRWGEVILENILEKSGLRKGEEYFMEYQLYDAAGSPLRSEAKGTKMRPDAVVKYPDERHVILDAKVSLNAFIRYIENTEPEQQKAELKTHVQAIKNHILDLSIKAYDDYDKTLDFVMMFIPSEAAFIAALQGEPDLWDFAYDRRILIISPTNLIIALKLIVDLWKREYQNRNAQAIADRGAKLYDKFHGFVKNMQEMGGSLDAAQSKYQDAFNQLSAGRDNLIAQATKLKNLGVKTKNEIPSPLALSALAEDETAEENKEE
jgi:DNA recombination protein RmuC